MTLKQMEYFIAVVEQGSISAAARQLHISQPPLSMQIKLLEEELNTVLLERSTRFLKLSEAGKIFYEKAGELLKMSQELERELRDFDNKLDGIMKLGTISSSGCALLSERMLNFQKTYPAVHFEITEGNTYSLIEKLKDRQIEMAIVRTPFAPGNLECIYLEEEPMCAAAHESYFDGLRRDRITVRELKNKPLIFYRRFEQLIEETFLSEGIEPLVYCKNDDARTSLMWAEAGLGIAIVPKTIIPSIHSERLSFRELEEKKLYTRIAAVYRKDMYLSSLAKRFLEML